MIEVRRLAEGDPLEFEVVVHEGRGETHHHVAMSRDMCERLTAGKHSPEGFAEAKGASSRFLKIYDEYKKAPEVTRQRMYLETMERLFGGTDKIIMDSGTAAGGVAPYLRLDQLMRRPQTAPQTGGGR